ncbi:unnamed protein product [Gadus morhua 'NCC']
MVAEEIVIVLSGGGPWGFRLQGGLEQQKPLQVAKVRKRSKACRAGLREGDELVSINEQACGSLSHGQAMNLIDSSPGLLHIRVKRAPAGFQSVVLLTRAPSPRIDKEYRAALRAMSPAHSQHPPVREIHRSQSSLTSGLTSPPGSEAYYGETDSDADVMAYGRQRRQKRRSPNAANPGKLGGRSSPEGGETSEMSGYDSAPDARVFSGPLDGCVGFGGEGMRGTVVDGREALPGVARREVIYQPPAPGLWSSQTSTETSSIISSADDQGPRDGGPEEDSGFLEPSNVPLVSPERAKEAMMLGSRSQLVPMVGPIDTPVDETLSTTYVEKAKQAKLNRGDTAQDKHVKEAKTKCRTIASLLTDAPNPHSKGVLMFKKRRQRSKKYTLTSFGSVDEDMCQESQEEDGVFQGSESEFDEEGFSAAPDPTWDSDCLDKLDKRAAASTGGSGEMSGDAPSPGLSDTTGKGAQLFEQQRRRAAEHAKKTEAAQPKMPAQPQSQGRDQWQPHAEPQAQAVVPSPQMTQILRDDAQPMMAQAPVTVLGNQANSNISYTGVGTASMVMPPTSATPSESSIPDVLSSNVLNRTARPFAPGFITSRSATAPVVFRPSVAKKPQRPASAMIALTPFSTSSEPYNNVALAAMPPLQPIGPPSMFSPPFSQSVPGGPLPSTPMAFHNQIPQPPPYQVQHMQAPQPMTSAPQAPYTCVASPPMPPVSMHQPVSYGPVAPSDAAPLLQASVAAAPNPVVPIPPVQVPMVQTPPVQVSLAPSAPVSVVYQQAAVAPTPVPGSTGRTGILLDARRRGGKYKPMFNVPEVKKNSPNPHLLSMVQNLDERPARYRYGQPPEAYSEDVEEDYSDSGKGRMPPPVAPKPRVIHEAPQIPQAEGKGAQLFARRQNRMGMYVVDTPPETPYQQEVTYNAQSQALSPNPSLTSPWKYSPNIRAPPPIGYNPLLAPSVPVGPQRDAAKPENPARGGMGVQKEGIKALDFMRRQPYQLNPAMFSYGGSNANLSAMPSYQAQQQQHAGYSNTLVGSSLTQPRQIPLKTARVYEIKRFSTPTPMTAPSLTPKVIAPRSATTLGERITRSDMISPPAKPLTQTHASFSTFAPTSAPLTEFNYSAAPAAGVPAFPSYAPAPAPRPAPSLFQPAGLPSLPHINTAPIPHYVPNAHPMPYTPVSYTSGLQYAKQFQSAPELSILASLPPLKPNPVQVPKPRFVATKRGVQPGVWRPGAF